MRRFVAAVLLTCPLFAQSGAERDRKWREDLDYVASEVSRVHPLLFSRVSRGDFDNAVAALRNAISDKSDTQVIAGISHVLALARDGHTDLNLFQSNTGFRMYPLRVQWFSDGLFVTKASAPFASAIGKRVTAIGGMPIEDAYTAVRQFVSFENDSFARARSENLLVSPEALHAADVIRAPATAEYEVTDAAGATSKFTVDVTGAPLLNPHPSAPANPLNLRNPELNYWFHYLEDRRVLYIKYNACVESPLLPMKSFAADVVATMKTRPVNRVIFDLRHNGGGSSQLLMELGQAMETVIASGQAQIPSAVVITSRRTFSSAVNNTLTLKEGGAVLVGENTGGLPATADIRTFTMPNSRLSFRSTAILQPAISTTYIPVDVEVPFNGGDFFRETDPWLEAALTVEARPPVLP